MALRFTLALASLLALPLASAGAEDSYRHSRIREVQGSVTLQRATEPGAEEALPNLPFLPGDRLWTDASGRVELQFADGSIVRLDSRSKLDYAAHEGLRRDERAVLRLWSGSLFLHYRDGRGAPQFIVETPEGTFEPAERGVYRLDVGPGEARLVVHEGEAGFEAGRRVQVAGGEYLLVREGETYAGPERFDSREAEDDFARWDQERERDLHYAEARPEYLPDEVSPYGPELAQYGTWNTHPEYGHIWYPRVDPGWSPYMHGHWAWTSYGWTWIAREPWGWAPSHYGRWGWAPAGWYWIPGRSWGPGWVSWSLGGDYVGWCPLGWRDSPVLIHERGRARGHAVRRGSSTLEASTLRTPWFYVRRHDLGRRDVTRRRLDSALLANAELRTVPSPHVRLTRDVRLVEAGVVAAQPGATPRNVKTKPTPGDTVQELRADPMTTIRRPMPRQRRPRDEDGQREAAAPAAGSGGGGQPPAGVSVPGQARPARPWTERQPGETRSEDRRRPPDSEGTARSRPRSDDPEREVLRPLFGPLSRPRGEQGSASERPRRDGDAGRGAASGRPSDRDGASRGSDAETRRAPRPERGGGGGLSRPSGPAARPAAPAPSAPQPQTERARPRPKDKE